MFCGPPSPDPLEVRKPGTLGCGYPKFSRANYRLSDPRVRLSQLPVISLSRYTKSLNLILKKDKIGLQQINDVYKMIQFYHFTLSLFSDFWQTLMHMAKFHKQVAKNLQLG